jgi:hypothetical protein
VPRSRGRDAAPRSSGATFLPRARSCTASAPTCSAEPAGTTRRSLRSTLR